MLLLSVDVFLPAVDVFLSAAVLSSDDLSEALSDAVFALSELPAAGAELSLVSDCVPLFCLLSLSTTFVSFNASFSQAQASRFQLQYPAYFLSH